MAAAAVCLARGLDPAAVAAGLASFPGVPHRLELIARVEAVAWINDSKATNVQSTIMALQAFHEGVHLIAGGRGKGQDFRPLSEPVAERCRAAYLIGEAAGELQVVLAGTGLPLHRCGDLATAVRLAGQAARPGDTVLLSPACASYDQFRDFEARGEEFRTLVEAL
jgi:UDP-N-acetylmuramoylalanine--D-glutamate ligase